MEQDIKKPMPGNRVMCYPGDEDPTQVFPATVVQLSGSLTANLHVLTMNPDAPIVLKSEVKHKSDVEAGLPYWDWPTAE